MPEVTVEYTDVELLASVPFELKSQTPARTTKSLRVNESDIVMRPVLDRRFACAVRVLPAEEGGFIASAIDLPGAVSQGATEAQALERVSEALAGLLESYLESGEDIPWDDTAEWAEDDPTVYSVTVSG